MTLWSTFALWRNVHQTLRCFTIISQLGHIFNVSCYNVIWICNKQTNKLVSLSLENIWTLYRVPTLFRNQISCTFQASYWFFKGSKIHINPYTPKISMLILLSTALHALHNFGWLLTDFQNFPGPVAFFQDFPVLENAIVKFRVFQDPYEPWVCIEENKACISVCW